VLKIAQISDLHIGPEDILYNGIDVRVNFLKSLKVALKKNPDYIVLSGDLAIDFGEIEAYYWVKGEMDKCGVPYLVMSGNHDSVERMKKVFHFEDKLYQNMLCYRFDFLNKYPAFFLDSEPDVIAEDQLVWLLEETKKIEGEALLFIHHPPTLCDHKFMDRKFPLRNISMVQKYLLEIPNISHIMVGHYHFAKTVPIDGNKTVLVAPATQMQISPNNPDFEYGDKRPGFRFIEWDGSHLKSEVIMVD
jgi:Icc protein